MGRHTTPKYVIDLDTTIGNHTHVWRVTSSGGNVGYGKPNYLNIQTYVDKWEQSFREGGCNQHAVKAGEVVKVREARVRNQFTGDTVHEVLFR